MKALLQQPRSPRTVAAAASVFAAVLLLRLLGGGQLGPGGPHSLDQVANVTYGLVAGLAWLVLLAALMRPAPRNRRAVGWLLLAAASCAVTGLILVDELNRRLDDGPAQAWDTRVIGKVSMPDPHSDTHYLVDIAGDGEARLLRLRVSEAAFERLAPGDRVTLHRRDGAFGIPGSSPWPWIRTRRARPVRRADDRPSGDPAGQRCTSQTGSPAASSRRTSCTRSKPAWQVRSSCRRASRRCW